MLYKSIKVTWDIMEEDHTLEGGSLGKRRGTEKEIN